MNRLNENYSQRRPIAQADTYTQPDNRPLISGTGRSIAASFFIWFVAPFVAYLALTGVFGILIGSMQALEYFDVPTNMALAASLLVTAACVKLIFNAGCRIFRRYTPD